MGSMMGFGLNWEGRKKKVAHDQIGSNPLLQLVN
jgi:hypothetical protein